MNIAVVGSEGFALGFMLVGIEDVFGADRGSVAETMEKLLASKDHAIVIVEESLLDALPRTLRYRVTNTIWPMFVTMGQSGWEELQKKVKRAVGIDIYKGGGG